MKLKQIFKRVENEMEFKNNIPNTFIRDQSITINPYEVCANFAMNEKLTDDDIIDNKEIRDNITKDLQNIEAGIQVLAKVGSLMLYPNGYATKEMVMKYFEVNQKTLEGCIRDNKEELIENGLVLLQGDELKEFKKYIKELNLSLEEVLKRECESNIADLDYPGQLYPEIHPFAQSILLFDRRVILNIAMLLRDNYVAKEIRKFILNITESPHYKDLAIQQLTNIISSLLNRTDILTKKVDDMEKTINKHTDDIDATQEAVLSIANKTNMI